MPRHHRLWGPPPPPPHHHHEGHPPPPHHNGDERHWYSPLPDESDLALLEEILGNSDQARAVFRIFTSSPPEVAAVGCLVLRQFRQLESLLQSLSERVEAFESPTKKQENKDATQ